MEEKLIAKNETRWNFQLKMVQQTIEVDIEKVVEKKVTMLDQL